MPFPDLQFPRTTGLPAPVLAGRFGPAHASRVTVGADTTGRHPNQDGAGVRQHPQPGVIPPTTAISRLTAIPPPRTGWVKCGGVRAWSPYAADSAARSCFERAPRPCEALWKSSADAAARSITFEPRAPCQSADRRRRIRRFLMARTTLPRSPERPEPDRYPRTVRRHRHLRVRGSPTRSLRDAQTIRLESSAASNAHRHAERHGSGSLSTSS